MRSGFLLPAIQAVQTSKSHRTIHRYYTNSPLVLPVLNYALLQWMKCPVLLFLRFLYLLLFFVPNFCTDSAPPQGPRPVECTEGLLSFSTLFRTMQIQCAYNWTIPEILDLMCWFPVWAVQEPLHNKHKAFGQLCLCF